MLLEHFVSTSIHAQSVAELFRLFSNAASAYGYNQAIFSLLTDHPMLGLKAQHGLLHTYPEGWMRLYAERKFEAIDPVRQYLPFADAPFTWDSLQQAGRLNNQQQDFMKLAASAGLRKGMGVPLRGPRGVIAGIGLASSNDNLILQEPDADALFLIAQQFYHRFRALEKKGAVDQRESYLHATLGGGSMQQ